MGKSRKRPVKQHYVPQCYLRQFANKHGKAHHVSVFDRKEERSYKNNTQDVACQISDSTLNAALRVSDTTRSN